MAIVKALEGDSRGLLWDLADVWAGRLALLLGLAALALGLVAFAVRLLPGGPEAAAREPMLVSRRGRDRPARVSLIALLFAIALLVLAGYAGTEATRGTLALTGAGTSFTIGEDARVVERHRDWRNRLSVYAQTDAGRVALEGGTGADGERYVAYPGDAARAWRVSASGWLLLAFVAVVALATLAGAPAIAVGQWRSVRAARRGDRAGRAASGSRHGRLGSGSPARARRLRRRAGEPGVRIRADRLGRRARADRRGRGRHPAAPRGRRTRAGARRPGGGAAVPDDPPEGAPVRVRVRVARYADGAAAAAAARAWGAAERRSADSRGRRAVEVPGAVGATADDDRESLTLGRAAGDALVVVELEAGDLGLIPPVGRDAVEPGAAAARARDPRRGGRRGAAAARRAARRGGAERATADRTRRGGPAGDRTRPAVGRIWGRCPQSALADRHRRRARARRRVDRHARAARARRARHDRRGRRGGHRRLHGRARRGCCCRRAARRRIAARGAGRGGLRRLRARRRALRAGRRRSRRCSPCRALQAVGRGAPALVAAFALLRRRAGCGSAAAVFATAVGPALGGALTAGLRLAGDLPRPGAVALAAAAAPGARRARGRAPRAAPTRRPQDARSLLALAGAPARSSRSRSSAALTAVLFLLVLLLVAGWRVAAGRRGRGLVLPLAALAGARIRGDAAARAAAGSALVGAACSRWPSCRGARVAWTVAPRSLAGLGMGLALPALGGELLPERTPRDAAALLAVRHAGIALALLVLAPVAAAQLERLDRRAASAASRSCSTRALAAGEAALAPRCSRPRPGRPARRARAGARRARRRRFAVERDQRRPTPS